MIAIHPRRRKVTRILIILFQLLPRGLVVVAWLSSSLTTRHDLLTTRSVASSEAKNEESITIGIGIGIDLGTTRSAVAYLQDGIPTIISIPANGRTMPSVVSVKYEGPPSNSNSPQVLVGENACQAEARYRAYRNVKRVIGTGGRIPTDIQRVVPHVVVNPAGKTYRKDSLANQIHDAQHHPTRLKPLHSNMRTNNTFLSQSSDEGLIAPEAISSFILNELKQAAEDTVGKPVSRAVIGVPAYFNDAQREATVRAARLAGLNKVKLLREPEAAALAYGIGKQQLRLNPDEPDELVLVFDLGGGTFDVSMLLVGGGVTEVICTAGNNRLGGTNFDGKIAQHCLQLLREKGVVASSGWSEHTRHALVRSAEQIRIFLSNNRKANIALPITELDWNRMLDPSSVLLPLNGHNDDLPAEGMSNSTHVLFQMSRRTMERLCQDEFRALLRPIREVAIMSRALLPGDASPKLVENALDSDEEDPFPVVFGDFYEQSDESSVKHIDADTTLLDLQNIRMKETKKAQQRGRRSARTVSKQEQKYRIEKRHLADSVRDRDLEGVKVRDGITGRPISRIVLVGGATRMPAVGRLIAALTGVVPQKTVNPDEAVALGCAVHVGVLDGVAGIGMVLNPMQAAILRAVAEQKGTISKSRLVDDNDEDF